MIAQRVGLKIFDPLEIIERDRIRRDLLLVDRIAIDEAQLQLARSYAELLCQLHNKDPKALVGKFDEELDTLSELGLLWSVSVRDARLPNDLRKKVEAIEQGASRSLEHKQPFRITMPDGSSRIIDPLGSYVLNRTRADLFRARTLAKQSSKADTHMIPLASGRISSLFDRAPGDATVLRVVLANLPVPSLDTPLEKVLAFTSDSDTRAKLARLRSWMVDMAKAELDETQIQTKLESALDDYQASMKSHKIKSAASTVELLVVTTAEVIENVVRLKFSEVAKKLFQLFKEDCALTDAERESPGKELAFIDSATTAFAANQNA